MNEINLEKMYKFEDLQKAGCILRKALKEIRTITNNCQSYSNSLNLSSSSSSNNSSIYNNELEVEMDSPPPPSCFRILAFDNLTYLSSMEDLTIQANKTSNQEVFKKTLKSIKRKDKLKKVPVIETREKLNHAKSLPALNEDTDSNLISNNEFEKQLRKVFRDKAVTRSLRRAKSVYYRNRRSKSLEDLSVEEKINFILNTNSSYMKINSMELRSKKSRRMSRQNSALSVDSTCSGLASDISSSYFHELSDWSPDYSSSESESSEDDLFHNIDWDANFSSVALSGFNTSNESDDETDEEEEDDKIFKTQNVARDQEEECLKAILTQKLENDAERVEKMLNEVMSRMLKLHPGFLNEALSTSTGPASLDILNSLKSFQINNQYLNDCNNQLKCFICMSLFDLDEDATSLSCEHTFHSNCIQAWFSKSSSCPTCRHNYLKRSNSLITDSRLLTKRETLL